MRSILLNGAIVFLAHHDTLRARSTGDRGIAQAVDLDDDLFGA